MLPITFSYLHAADVAQIKSKGVHNKHTRIAKESLGVRGLSRINSGRGKGKYRWKAPGYRDADDHAAKKLATSSIEDAQLAEEEVQLAEEEEAKSDDGE